MPNKTKEVQKTNDQIRGIMLRYFYDRNANATSARGKKGAAAKISDVKADLKKSQDLSPQDVWANLTYLLSQGWVEEDPVEKSVALRSGTVIPRSTPYYKITALGIDKIEGPGEFTVDKFKGIKIEATGQNIITVGDGNRVNAQFQGAAQALADLKGKLLESPQLQEAQKLDAVADIDTIQSQLAKATPNPSVIRVAWESIKDTALVVGLTVDVQRLTELLHQWLG